MRRHVIGLLIALNAALVLSLAALWVTPGGELRNVAWQPPAPIKPDFSAGAAASAGMNVEGFVATLDRPLFSPNRLPPPAKAAGGVQVQADPLSNIRLYGIYAGSEAAGIIARVDGKDRRIRLNEKVGDWTVARIKDRDVTFTRGGEERVIRLGPAGGAPQSREAAARADGAPGAGAQAPAAGAQAPATALRDMRLRMLEEQRARMSGRRSPSPPR